jgi:ABC-2 type transport system ATP-binding protein
MPATVVVSDLRKSYGSTVAADGIGFEIQSGEIFGLIGPNGAGKTTTVECLIGLREPDAGTIEVCGIDARKRPAEVKEKIGAALQTTALQDKITPREAIDLFGAFYRRRAETGRLLTHFSLTEKADAPFDSLSGGQRQRLALALAFVNEPEFVVLDEPTAGLDPAVRRDLRSDIQRMRHDGFTVLMTTHDMEEAEQLCDRIAVIDRGRLVATGTPQELVSRSTATTAISLGASAVLDRDSQAAIDGVRDLTVDGARARFRSDDVNRTLAALVALLQNRHITITDLHVEKASLEDVLIELTSRPGGR